MKQIASIVAGIVMIALGIAFPSPMRKRDATAIITPPRFMAARASGGCVVLGAILILMAFT